jgi:hypothetical protein
MNASPGEGLVHGAGRLAWPSLVPSRLNTGPFSNEPFTGIMGVEADVTAAIPAASARLAAFAGRCDGHESMRVDEDI